MLLTYMTQLAQDNGACDLLCKRLLELAQHYESALPLKQAKVFQEIIRILQDVTYRVRTMTAEEQQSEATGQLLAAGRELVQHFPPTAAIESFMARVGTCVRFYVLDWFAHLNAAAKANPDSTPARLKQVNDGLVAIATELLDDAVRQMAVVEVPLYDRELHRQPLLALWRKLMFVFDSRITSRDFCGHLCELMDRLECTPDSPVRCQEDKSEFGWRLLFLVVGLYHFDAQGERARSTGEHARPFVPANWLLVHVLLDQSPLAAKHKYKPTEHFWAQQEEAFKRALPSRQPTLTQL